MLKTIKIIARDYYLALDYAFRTKDFNRLKRFLADDCKLKALSASFIGKEAILKFMSSTISLVNKFEIRRQYFDHDSCCTIMDLITPIPDLHVNTIEWIVFRDSQVVEINAIFDVLASNRFMQLVQDGDLFTTKNFAQE